MNIEKGFQAAGRGLALIAENVGRREEREWQALREENLMQLRHKQDVEIQGARFEHDTNENEKQRTFVAGENAANRKADDARQGRADARADSRQNRADTKNDSRELMQMRRHRSGTLATFDSNIAHAEAALTKAQESGMVDEGRLDELQQRVDDLYQNRADFDIESVDQLASLGDAWAIARAHTEDPGGGSGPPVITEQGAWAATTKPKPMQAKPAAPAASAATAAAGAPMRKPTLISEEPEQDNRFVYTKTEPGKSPIPLVNAAQAVRKRLGIKPTGPY